MSHESPHSTPHGENAGQGGPTGHRIRSSGRVFGRGVARVGRASGRGARRGAQGAFRLARRASHAQGAGESGLYRLIELHAFNAAGDAAFAISLAGTLFFAQPGGAKGPVALFLGLTMLPFAVVAPLIGPFLDRFAHGRRWAIGATMAIRGICCLALADTITHNSPFMYPAALGCLVSSKAYGVTRAAAVPRLLPENLSLVKANSRISLAGVVGAAISGPLAAGASMLGPQWSLRYAFCVFAGATVLAILLPAGADSTHGEQDVTLTGRPMKFRSPPSIVFALRCNAGLRMLSGFLTIYMAFLLRNHPLPGWEHKTTLLMGLVIGAAGLGNTVGVSLGSVLRLNRPAVTTVSALVADATMAVLCAVFYGLMPAIALGLCAGVAQALGKQSLDALLQREVPERVRTSVFARAETLLQLGWVTGGLIGIALPLNPAIGLGTLASLMTGWATFVVLRRPASPEPVQLQPWPSRESDR